MRQIINEHDRFGYRMFKGVGLAGAFLGIGTSLMLASGNNVHAAENTDSNSTDKTASVKTDETNTEVKPEIRHMDSGSQAAQETKTAMSQQLNLKKHVSDFTDNTQNTVQTKKAAVETNTFSVKKNVKAANLYGDSKVAAGANNTVNNSVSKAAAQNTQKSTVTKDLNVVNHVNISYQYADNSTYTPSKDKNPNSVPFDSEYKVDTTNAGKSYMGETNIQLTTTYDRTNYYDQSGTVTSSKLGNYKTTSDSSFVSFKNGATTPSLDFNLFPGDYTKGPVSFLRYGAAVSLYKNGKLMNSDFIPDAATDEVNFQLIADPNKTYNGLGTLVGDNYEIRVSLFKRPIDVYAQYTDEQGKNIGSKQKVGVAYYDSPVTAYLKSPDDYKYTFKNPNDLSYQVGFDTKAESLSVSDNSNINPSVDTDNNEHNVVNLTIQMATKHQTFTKDTPENQLPNGVKHSDFTRTLTQKITAKLPTGDKDLSRSATIERTYDYDPVAKTGKWNVWSSTDMPAVKIPQVDGYEPNIKGDTNGEIPKLHVNEATTQADLPIITIGYNKKAPNMVSEDFQFVDDNDNGKVVNTITETGAVGSKADLSNLAVPTNYKLADGQKLPTDYTFKAGDAAYKIHVVHGTKDLSGNTGKGVKDQHGKDVYDESHKSISRTIYVNKPDGSKTPVVQTVTFTRGAILDNVTGYVNYGPWSDNGKVSLPAYNAPEIKGYKAEPASIAAKEVTPDTVLKDNEAKQNINYVPLIAQSVVSYVDANGKPVMGTDGKPATQVISGYPNTPVAFNPEYPDGYVAQDPSKIPATITPGSKVDPIKVKDGTYTVTYNHPVNKGDQIPSTKTRKFDAGATKDDLNKNVTRTITVHIPAEIPTKDGSHEKVVTQTVPIHRNASMDSVTGKLINYTPWEADSPTYPAVNIPSIPGYTPQINGKDVDSIPSAETDPNNKDSKAQNPNVDVTYRKNTDSDDHGTTVKVTDEIDYMNNGQKVGSTKVSGNSGENVTLDDKTLPAGYKFHNNNDKTVILDGKAHQIAVDKVALDAPAQGTSTAHFIGPDGKEVGHQDITGDKGKTVPFTPNYPKGFKPAPDQNIPKNVTIGDNIPNISVIPDTPSKPDTPEQGKSTAHFIGPDGKEVGHQDITGDKGKTVPFTPNYPKGFKPAPGQNIPKNVTIGDNIPNIIVVPDTPSTPSKPDTPEQGKSTAHYVGPDGKEIGHQDITGDKGKTVPFVPEYPKGFKPAPGQNVPKTVTIGDDIPTIKVIPDVPSEENQNVDYVDENGKIVGSQVVSGKKGESVPFVPVLPDGYVKAKGAKVPESVTIGVAVDPIKVQDGTLAVSYPVKQGDKIDGTKARTYAQDIKSTDLTKTIRRVITVTLPNGTKQAIDQAIKAHRKAVVDTVTGKVISFTDWTLEKPAFDSVPLPTEKGYTPQINGKDVTEIPATDADADAKDGSYNIDVTYRQTNPDNGGSTTPYVPDDSNNSSSTDNNKGADKDANKGDQDADKDADKNGNKTDNTSDKDSDALDEIVNGLNKLGKKVDNLGHRVDRLGRRGASNGNGSGAGYGSAYGNGAGYGAGYGAGASANEIAQQAIPATVSPAMYANMIAGRAQGNIPSQGMLPQTGASTKDELGVAMAGLVMIAVSAAAGLGLRKHKYEA